MEPEFEAFIDCWNAGRFFEAHEVLEGLWIRTRDEVQRGLIQLAAALYHVQRGNLRGARTMLERSLSRLGGNALRSPVPVADMVAYAQRMLRDLTDANGAAILNSRPRM